jgi:hypothetical protein
MVERELRPIYGPWRIYTREEETAQIQESLARQNKFNRDWEARKDSQKRRAMNILDREIVDRNM